MKNRVCKTLLWAFALFLAAPHPCFGEYYLNFFGGAGDTDKAHVEQRGFAFNNSDATEALLVDAKGKSGRFVSAIGGAHFGYVFPTTWVKPVLEFEGFYLQAFSGKNTGYLFNPTHFEHEFVDTLPLRAFALFGDFLLRFPRVLRIEPYIGGGVGGAEMWIAKGNSRQLSPAEPGVNHFNAKRSASDSAFAAQGKAGLLLHLSEHFRLFVEYRHVYLASTDYIFGFTQYADHAPTSDWILHLGQLNYNLGLLGIGYGF